MFPRDCSWRDVYKRQLKRNHKCPHLLPIFGANLIIQDSKILILYQRRMDYSTIVKKQNDFFNRNETKSIPFRLAQLKRLKALLQQEEANLYRAIYDDFKKSQADTYATELSFIYDCLLYTSSRAF